MNKGRTEIDSWCIKITNENRDIVRIYFLTEMSIFTNRPFSIGAYYGVDKEGIARGVSDKFSYKFNKVLETQEFLQKINKTISNYEIY